MNESSGLTAVLDLAVEEAKSKADATKNYEEQMNTMLLTKELSTIAAQCLKVGVRQNVVLDSIIHE